MPRACRLLHALALALALAPAAAPSAPLPTGQLTPAKPPRIIPPPPPPAPPPPSTLEAGLDAIAARYVDAIPREELERRALAALLRDLDPYSRLLDPATLAEDRATLEAVEVGAGLLLDFDRRAWLPVVQAVARDGPAQAAGVQVGDHVLAVDGEPMRREGGGTITVDLQGAPGSTLDLVLRRDGEAQARSVRLVRTRIPAPGLHAWRRDAADAPDWWLDRARGLAYVRIASVALDTRARFGALLTQLEAAGLRGLVLDLRECPGGALNGALGAADLLVPEGRLLVLRERTRHVVYDALPGALTAAPVVVLIDEGTTSACEILAAALQDRGRARLVGTRSFGKARAQTLVGFGPGQERMWLSTGTYQRPAGGTIDRHDAGADAVLAGVAPDVEVALPEALRPAWREHLARAASPYRYAPAPPPEDPVLARALELLAATPPAPEPHP